MDNVVKQMTQLSLEQTRALFEAFTGSCSRDQKLFLETELPYLLTQDFLTLPSLTIDKILAHLDVNSLLILRLVCIICL